MGYLVHILLALFLQALAEEGLAAPREAPFAVLALCAVPYVLAAAARAASLRGRFSRAGKLLGVLNVSPVVLHALALLAFGWNASVERLTGSPVRLLGWPSPASLLALAPLVVYALLVIDARARALHTHAAAVVHAWRFHGRMLLSALAPLVVYVLIAWGVGSSDELRARIDHVQLYGALFAGALLVLFLALLPFLLTRTWDTAPMQSGALRELLESLARRARFRCREILLWRTGGQMANAAVVGIAPPLRVVLLSDALLGQLLPRETMAVFAHEIGHAKRHHVLVFVAWSAAFFLGVDLAATRWIGDDALIAGAVLLAAVVVWYLGFGWLSRRFELDADLYSAELLDDVEPMVSALEIVGGPHGRGRRTWRHFSTGDRVDFLRRLPHQPELGIGLRRRLRVLAWSGAALAVLALLGEGAAVAAAFNGESIRAELALGRYDRAATRLAGEAEPDPELVRLVVAAEGVVRHDGIAALDAIEAAAIEALGRGELERARALVTLARLRGAHELDAVAAVLEELAPEAGSEALAAAADGLAPIHGAWARALLAAAAAR